MAEVAVLPIDLIKFIDEEINGWGIMHQEGVNNQLASGAIIALKDVRKKIFENNKGKTDC